MEIRKRKEDIATIVEIAGRLDTVNYPVLEKAIEELAAGEEKNIIMDLKEVDYVSSSGLRALLIGLKKFKEIGGKFVLCDLKENVSEIFNIAGFSTVFKIYKNCQEAMENLNE